MGLKNLINESENPAQQLAQLRQRVAELEAVLAAEQMMRQRVETALRDREAYKFYQVILDDALRPLADPGEIQLAACRVLAEHIGASQVLYADVIDEKQITVRRGSIDGAPPNLDAVPGNELNDIALEEYKAGKFLVINDINSSPRLTETERRVFKSLGVAAHLSRGLIKEGRWIAALGVNSSAPRVWTQVELDLVDETIQRNWAAVAEARAEEKARKVRDHLEEKVAERTAELARERQRLFDVLETLPFNICLIAPDYRIPFANRAFRERFGESNGRHCYDFMFSLDKPCEECQCFVPLATKQPHDWIFSAPDGSIIKVYDRLFTDVDGQSMVLEMNIDITKQKKMEAELARLDRLNLIGQMAAGIGHEIRNPMTAVRGFLQMLGDKPEYADDRAFFELMIEELDRANSIISEYLGLARDKMIDLQPGSLDVVINLLYPMIRSEANLREIAVHLELDGLSPCLIDKNEIRQLIMNMSSNAMDAMSSHGTLTIGTRQEGDEVVLYIRDQGGGLAPGIIDQLGTPFVTTKDRGTGLGLAICYSIAARHQARIDYETGPEGTTFWVKFPIAGKLTSDQLGKIGGGGGVT